MRGKLLLVLAALGLTALAQAPIHAQTEPGRYLYAGDNSIVLQPAARVADDTTDLSWSPDGSRLIALNTHTRPIDAGDPEASTEFTVVRWVRANHAASTLYSIRITGSTDLIYPISWLPTTDTAIADMGWQEHLPPILVNGVAQKQSAPHHILLWMDVRRGSVRHLEIGERDLLLISPKRPLAVLMHVPRYKQLEKSLLTTIRPDGTLGKAYEFNANQRVKRPSWSHDGRSLDFTLVTLDDSQNNTVGTIQSHYDPLTGEVGKLSVLPAHSEPPVRPAILQVSQPVRQMTEVETSAKVHPLWVSTAVRSEHPRLLACADADLGVLSPDGTAIAYRSQGSAWVSELKSIPLAQFKQMLVEAQREAAIQSGKAVALGLILWAIDNNETLPTQADLANVSPYIGDPNSLNGFNLVYGGGPIGNVASPAETVLGTIDGPGGVVDIYVDGHVKWRPN